MRWKRAWLAVAAVVAVVGAGGIWLLAAWAGSNRSSTGGQGPVATVTRGPLVISLTEAGEVEADRRKVISNELQWPVIIQQVVPEGTLVKEGQTIIQFECKELIDAITQQRLTVANVQNDYTAAHENLALKKKETDNSVRKSEQAVTDADEDQRKYVEKEWPVKEAEAKSAVILAETDLTLAKKKLDFKIAANKDPDLKTPYSEYEIKADQLAVDRIQQSYQKALDERDILLQYTNPRDLRKLKIAVEDAKLALERAQLQAKTDMLLAGAQEQTKKTMLDMNSDRLKDFLDQEAKLVVKAEKEGLVVYDTGGGRWSSVQVMVQVGEKINSRQQLMIIPDMSTLQVKTRVYEAMVDQVQPGLEALIRLDAKPDLPLTGKVSKVGVLPDSQNRWLSPDVKVFNVIVAMDQRPEGLKPGMTAQVELMLARLENVLSVPVAAVFTEQEKTYCWRPNGGKPEMAPIKIGRTNDRRAEIVSGLEEGDVVLLSPPPGAPPPGKATAKAAQTRPAADNGPPQGAERRASGREGGPDEAPARASGREPGREEPTTRPGRSAPGESPASRPRGRRGPQEDRQP